MSEIKGENKMSDCIFCKISEGQIPSTTLYEDNDFRVIFDVGPASKGHALILPKKHFDDVFSMDEETASKVFVVALKVAKAMKEVLDFDGMNIVQNNGTIAGQTVFHFHMHLIPRYKGDTVNIGWVPGKADTEVLAQLSEAISKALN